MIGQALAEKLKENYTILPLDKVTVNGVEDRAYCVITNDQVPITDIPALSQWVDLHNRLVDEYDKANYKFCTDAIVHLYDKFGGELNTFYDELQKRLESN
jgi:nucleoside-diphosphate-sugar epimerase